MTEHIQPEAEKTGRSEAAAPSPDVATDPTTGRRAGRRRLLAGGIATIPAIVTLSSRPAFATATNACTLSALASANVSRPINGKCGDSPGCWKNHDLNAWANGATFLGNPVQHTHSTLITTVLPGLSNAKFTVPSNATLLNMINGSITGFKVKMANNTKVDFWTSGQQLNIVAAILNQDFYGSKYSSTNVITTTIPGLLTALLTDAQNNNSSQIAADCSTVNSALDSLNNQGETCAL